MSGSVPIGDSLHATVFQPSRSPHQRERASSKEGAQPLDGDPVSKGERSSSDASLREEEAQRPPAAPPAVENLFRRAGFQLSFRVDEETKRVVISVIDQESKEVIRQVPPEELLELAEKLDAARGSVVKQTV